MKNMFKVAAVALASLVAMTAKSEALYWQVEAGSTEQEFQYAILNVTGGDLGSAQRLVGASAEGTAPNQYVSVQNTDISSYANSSYSFFVELANYNNGWEVVAETKPINYNNLQEYIATGFVDGLSIANGGGFNMASDGVVNVPEPTSGLLLLMGGAILALRRRRQK